MHCERHFGRAIVRIDEVEIGCRYADSAALGDRRREITSEHGRIIRCNNRQIERCRRRSRTVLVTILDGDVECCRGRIAAVVGKRDEAVDHVLAGERRRLPTPLTSTVPLTWFDAVNVTSAGPSSGSTKSKSAVVTPTVPPSRTDAARSPARTGGSLTGVTAKVERRSCRSRTILVTVFDTDVECSPLSSRYRRGQTQRARRSRPGRSTSSPPHH